VRPALHSFSASESCPNLNRNRCRLDRDEDCDNDRACAALHTPKLPHPHTLPPFASASAPSILLLRRSPARLHYASRDEARWGFRVFAVRLRWKPPIEPTAPLDECQRVAPYSRPANGVAHGSTLAFAKTMKTVTANNADEYAAARDSSSLTSGGLESIWSSKGFRKNWRRWRRCTALPTGPCYWRRTMVRGLGVLVYGAFQW